MSTIPEINQLQQYFTPDGRLTVEGLRLFRQFILTMKDHEARIVALEP